MHTACYQGTVITYAIQPMPGDLAEDEEQPQPGKRQKQVSNIIGYEDEWETAAAQAQGSDKGQQPQQEEIQGDLQDDSDSSQQLPTRQKRRLSKAGSQESPGNATLPAAKRAKFAMSDDEDESDAQPRSSKRRHSGSKTSTDQPSPTDVSRLLAKEGLDPIKEDAEGSRQRKSTKVGASSIRDRMQQHQQRLHQVCGSPPSGSPCTAVTLHANTSAYGLMFSQKERLRCC